MISLGDRMKRYENVNRNYLIRRMPVILRLDGKNFSSWTNKCIKPFDMDLSILIEHVMQYLMTNIQGAVIGYTQSDEISIFIRDYDNINTDMWFDGNIQKIVSISSSLATGFFNHNVKYINSLTNPPIAFFDARVFNIPKEEVCNYFICRQQDIIRNSVQMMGQHYLGHKKIQGKSNIEVGELLAALGLPIEEIPSRFRFGVVYEKDTYTLTDSLINDHRSVIDSHVYLDDSSQLTTEV